MFVPWVHEGGLRFPGSPLVSQLLHYIVDKFPRMVIIENVRGFTFKRNAGLLAHVKDCLQALHFSIHIRILCTP